VAKEIFNKDYSIKDSVHKVYWNAVLCYHLLGVVKTVWM